MKKHYNIPTTNSVSFRTDSLCDFLVTSVQGGTLNYGGEMDNIDPN